MGKNKDFNIDILQEFSQPKSTMDEIYEGVKPTETKDVPVKQTSNDNINKQNNVIINNETKKVQTTKKIEANKQKREKDHTLTRDEEGRKNKRNNYAVSIKIDEDLKEYLKKISWILFISERESKNINQYINDLIRVDMLKRLNLKSNVTYEQIQKEWENYKKANNI